MNIKTIFILIICLLTIGLSSCGKYAPPEPYEDSPYQRTYPKNM